MTLQELEKDPEFAKLSYQDQVLVRSKWASVNLSKDEDFQKLKPAERQAVINKLLYRPPVTIDPFYTKRAAKTAEEATAGNKTARDFMLWRTSSKAFMDSSLIGKGTSLFMSMTDGAHGAFDDFIKPDAAKESAYYDYVLSLDKATATKARIMKVVSGFAGMGIDMAVGYAALAGTVKAPKLLAKVTQEALMKRMVVAPFANTKNLVRFGMGIKNAVPNITHAVFGGGLVGAVREPLMKLVDGAITGENPSMQELLLTAAKSAGAYAAGDLLFFTLGAPIKLMAKNLKRTFTAAKFKGIKGLDEKEILQLMEDAASGKTFDQVLLDRVNQIDPSGQLHKTLLNAQDKLNLARRLDELLVGSAEHKQAMAASRGWSLDLVADASGKKQWVATGLWQPELKFAVGSDDAAGLFVLKTSLDPMAPLDDVFRADWTKRMNSAVGHAVPNGSEPVHAIRPQLYGSPGYPRNANKKLTKIQQKIQEFMFDNVAYMPGVSGLAGGSSGSYRPMIPEYTARAYFERAAQIEAGGTALSHLKGATFEDFRVAAEDMTTRGFFGPYSYALGKKGNSFSYVSGTITDDMWWRFAPEGDRIGMYSNYSKLMTGTGMYDEAFISYRNQVVNPNKSGFDQAYADIAKAEGAARVVSEDEVAKMAAGQYKSGVPVPFGLRYAVTRNEASYLLSRTGASGQKQFVKGFILVNNTADNVALGKGEAPIFSDKIVKFVPEGTAEYQVLAQAQKTATRPKNLPPTTEFYDGIVANPELRADIAPHLKKIANEYAVLSQSNPNLKAESFNAESMSRIRQEALAAGADAFYDKAGSLYILNPRQDLKFVDDAIKPLTADFVDFERVGVDASEVALKAANDKWQQLTLTITGIIGTDKKSRAVALAQLIAPKSGVVPKKNLQLAAQLLGEEAGIPRGSLPIEIIGEAQYMGKFPSGAKSTRTAAWYDTVEKKVYLKQAGGDAAKMFGSPAEQARHASTFIHEVAHAIQDYAEANGIKLKGKYWTTRAFKAKSKEFDSPVLGGTFNEGAADRFAETMTAKLMKYTTGSPGWMEWAVQKQGGRLLKTEQGWAITRPGSSTATVYQNVDDALKDILLHDRDTMFISMSLREQGKGVFQVMSDADFQAAVAAGGNPSKYKVTTYLGKNPRVRAEGNDMEQVLKEVGWQPKVSSNLGPELAVVDDVATGKVTYNAGVASGGYLDIIHHLNTFEGFTRSAKKKLRVNNDGVISFIGGGTPKYEVKVHGIDDTRVFDSAQEALEYLNGGWSTLDELQTTAMRKGYDLKMSPAGYHLWSADDGTSILAKNLTELQDQLTKVHVPDWAPELAGDYRGLEPMEYVEGTFMPSYFDQTMGKKRVSATDPLLEFSHWFRPRDAYLESALRAKKISPELMQAFRDTQLARRMSSGAMHDQATALVTIMSKEGKPGTLIDKERRVLIGRYLDNAGTDAQREAIKAQLTRHELNIAEGLRAWFDNLFNKFGIENRKYVENYVSHVRQNWLSNKKLTAGTMSDLLKRSGAPSKLSVFFDNFRNEDIPNFLMEDDIFKIAMSYNAIGHRAQFLNPALKKLDTAMKEAIKNPDIGKNGAIWAIGQYKDQVLGLYTANEEAVLRALEQFGKKVGFKDLTHMRDMYGAFYSVSYLATMGWRPYSAARNLMQIFQTLAPRFGNGNTVKGLEYFDKNAEYVHNLLMKKGILTEYMPVFGSETMDITGKFAKVVHKGLGWFKNADDITRGIAWSTARVQWDDATKTFKAMLNKGMSKDAATHAFMEISGLNLVGEDVRALAGKYIRGEIGNPKGSFEAAFDVFAQEVIDSTMFAYQAGLSPTAYRGLVGKMFGMFGVYPAWYLENIRRGLTYGNLGQKAMFATRLAMNSAALWGSFALMGMNAKDFLPWVPVQFTGGPFYKIANQLLNAIGNDYQARTARAELLKSIPRTMIPGSMLAEHLTKAVKAAEDGDPWGVWLHLISAPVIPAESRPLTKLIQ